MAEDCVKFIDKDVGKPSIQVVPKSVTVAPAALVAQPSDDGSYSSLNSAAFHETGPPASTSSTSTSATAATEGTTSHRNMTTSSSSGNKGSNNNQHPLQIIHHNISTSNNNSNLMTNAPTTPGHQQTVANNIIINGNNCELSQNNLCNGGLQTNGNGNGTSSNLALVRKVHNHSPNGLKRPMVTLTHLPKRPPVDIEFSELSYSVPEGKLKKSFKTILRCVQGQFQSGLLTAIMGPSGAGKSTLMNILAGYKTSNLSGSVLINGKERNLRRFRKLSCYIMQDDRLLPYITVGESMMISANLKLGKDITTEAKRIVVEEIIEALGLTEARNTMSLNLSGGQRKRLSIGLELVNNPPVMFFDEPTSGLDSSTCFQLISLLKNLARGGRTIVCTIHQPSARLFEMFDHLYMLADGQCIYKGQVQGLVPFLSNIGFDCPSYHNPADYVMEVACGEYGESVHKLVMAVNNGKCLNYSTDKINNNNHNHHKAGNGSDSMQETSLSKLPPKVDFTAIQMPAIGAAEKGAGGSVSRPNCTTSLLDSNESVVALPGSKTGFPTSSWIQIWILLKRSFLTIFRDQQLTHMRLAAHVLVGSIIGMIYYDIGNDASKVMSNAGCIFFTALFTMFTAMMPTLLTFPTEMAVFVREHLNYWYSLKAFYFAKTVADLPFQILFASVYVMVVYYLTSQPMEWERVSMFVLICLLTSLVAQSLGLLIGAGLSVELGVFLGPVSTIPTILFSGFFVNLDTIPGYLQWVTYVSYVRYGFEGAMIAIYGMDRPKMDCEEIYCHYRSPKKFLEEMSMDKAQYWIDALALFGIFIALRIVAYFVLRWKIHSIR